MFSRHPRSVFMLRTHFIKHFFGFPPHFLVIHTLLDHNTSYLPTPFFSDLTELEFDFTFSNTTLAANEAATARSTNAIPTGYRITGVIGIGTGQSLFGIRGYQLENNGTTGAINVFNRSTSSSYSGEPSMKVLIAKAH